MAECAMKLGLLVLLLAMPVTADVTIYTNDFEGAVGTEWSMLPLGQTQWVAPPTSVTPATQDQFLGELSNGMLALTLTNLPAHSQVTLSMDLFIIRSWDGNYASDARGPDFWGYALNDIPSDPEDPTQWDSFTTFSNWHPDTGPHQAYPNTYPTGDYPARTGASENNTLGYTFDEGQGPFAQDAVYELTTGTFAHSASTLTVAFGAVNLQSITDESWGIDDFEVVLDVPEPSGILFIVAGALLAAKRKRI